jgi:hypothetical protein
MQIQIETSPTAPNRHSIDNNFFGNRAAGSGNGFETIRIGYSHQQNNNSATTFARNLFYKCNGENEILSNKSSGNRIVYNTFRDNAGELTCRHGDRAWIEGNFFLNQDRGMRIIGSDHVIINNYIANMRTDGILLYNGQPNPQPTGYEQVSNPLVAFNTIVDCPAGIVIGGGSGNVPPKNVRLANNAISLPAGTAIRIQNAPQGITYEANFVQARSAGVTHAGVVAKTLLLAKDADGIQRPASGSPLQDAAAGSFADITLDLNGWERGGPKDVGAEEIGGGTRPARPLTEKDVGPYWMGNAVSISQRLQPLKKTRATVLWLPTGGQPHDLLGRRLDAPAFPTR